MVITLSRNEVVKGCRNLQSAAGNF